MPSITIYEVVLKRRYTGKVIDRSLWLQRKYAIEELLDEIAVQVDGYIQEHKVWYYKEEDKDDT